MTSTAAVLDTKADASALVASLTQRIRAMKTTTEDLPMVLDQFERVPMTLALLQSTGCGLALNDFRKNTTLVQSPVLLARCKALILRWKSIVTTTSPPISPKPTTTTPTIVGNKRTTSDPVPEPERPSKRVCAHDSRSEKNPDVPSTVTATATTAAAEQKKMTTTTTTSEPTPRVLTAEQRKSLDDQYARIPPRALQKTIKGGVLPLVLDDMDDDGWFDYWNVDCKSVIAAHGLELSDEHALLDALRSYNATRYRAGLAPACLPLVTPSKPVSGAVAGVAAASASSVSGAAKPTSQLSALKWQDSAFWTQKINTLEQEYRFASKARKTRPHFQSKAVVESGFYRPGDLIEIDYADGPVRYTVVETKVSKVHAEKVGDSKRRIQFHGAYSFVTKLVPRATA